MKIAESINGTESTQREAWVDVTVHADSSESTLRLVETDGSTHNFVAHDAPTLVTALSHNGGAAQYCAKYNRLLVPGATGTGSMPFYKLEPVSLPLSA